MEGDRHERAGGVEQVHRRFTQEYGATILA
jgi:hypothetical protein